MKVFMLIACLTFIELTRAQITTRFVDLRLDHFNPLDRRSFDGRYFHNGEFYLPGGPIFIYVSSGFEVYEEFLTRGNIYEIASDTRGHLFALEHRYYGTSRPSEDTSVENLRWLTIHQALADLAQFINFIKANYYGARNSRVVLWGRGYGGSLAVWARQKYPSLVDGAFASSAPINAVLENPQFMRNAFYTITSIGGSECGEILHGAFRFIEDSIRQRNTTYIEQRLQLCSPIDIDVAEDVSRLYYGISADIGYQFVSHSRYGDIDEKCTIMRGLDTDIPAENDLDAFSRWFVDEYNRNLECLNYSNEAVLRRYQQVEWDTVSTIAGLRQNFWLQCTQLGQFAVANEGESHPFGWRFDISFFRQWCAQAFDQELFTDDFIDESIASTNDYFGGLRPNIYRVFLTHGEMDPSRSLGPSEDLNANSPVVVMALQSSARDLGSPAEAEYPVLVEVKQRVREQILQWIVDAIEELPTDAPTTTTTEGTPFNITRFLQ